MIPNPRANPKQRTASPSFAEWVQAGISEEERASDADPFAEAELCLRADYGLTHPKLRKAANLIAANSADLAEPILNKHLAAGPGDPSALNLLAEVMLQFKRPDRAKAILEKCILVAPDYVPGRFRYVNVLVELNETETALAQIELLLQRQPRNPIFRKLKLLLLEWNGEYELSVECCRELLADYSTRADVWLRYGHSLRNLGRQEECIAAYKEAISLSPQYGGAYWGLANLKTYRFTDGEITQMQALLKDGVLTAEHRTLVHFALGKAYGDQKSYKQSFENYAHGNAIYSLVVNDDSDVLTAHVSRCKAVFTPAFFRERQGFGFVAKDPIFVVGMPRAGSTLVEQILASHSAIEGVKELPDLMIIGRYLEDQVAPLRHTDYPGVLEKLHSAESRELGERYIRSTQIYRKRSCIHFTDKMGSNYLHIGLIQLILPNAKIIDVRRHPMACCFSNFVQHFAKAFTYTYRQKDLGRSYFDYVDLMARYDHALPGKIHRVFYEQLVANPDREIRRLLSYLELPFETACLDFHKNDRVVTTVSSEQVRSPINTKGLEQWRHYEDWLGPLKRALGPVLDCYPEVPLSMTIHGEPLV